ncbi:2-dehydropantoate 2-reductase [candidate division FCPU426 bacterium]|nr:2-dehydropantoate 2-reductase [candidate division FCPU426 bacterium]
MAAAHAKSAEVLVIGTGAVGGFYGAKLAQSGARVSVLCRSDYSAVKAGGIHIKSPQGDFTFRPKQVLQSLDEYRGNPDYILVTLKVLPQIDVARLIEKSVKPGTSVVLLQNGVGIEEPVARALPDTEIISGLAFVCLQRSGPGQIHHQCYGRLALGTYPAGSSEKVEKLCRLFAGADIPCLPEQDIIAARWRKLVWNAPFNPISVLSGGVTTAQILALPDTREMAEKIMAEVCLVARACGHPLEADIIPKNIQATEKMAPYKTSMLQDYTAGRPMEIEAILGAPLRMAKQHGLVTPYLEMTYSLMKLAERHLEEKKHFKASLVDFFGKKAAPPGNN